MLEEQDRVLPAQARTQQADRVGGVRGDRDFPAGRVDESAPRGSGYATDRPRAGSAGVLSTIGQAKRPPSASAACPRRRLFGGGIGYWRNWISGQGISPAKAMPTAQPTMPSSEGEVSNMERGCQGRSTP